MIHVIAMTINVIAYARMILSRFSDTCIAIHLLERRRQEAKMKRRRLNIATLKPETQVEKARDYFKKQEDPEGFIVRKLPLKGTS